jgi:hypothetical protein
MYIVKLSSGFRFGGGIDDETRAGEGMSNPMVLLGGYKPLIDAG